MNSSTVIDKISDLNYKGFKEAYIRQMEDVNYHQLSFDERVYDLHTPEQFGQPADLHPDTLPELIRTASRFIFGQF